MYREMEKDNTIETMRSSVDEITGAVRKKEVQCKSRSVANRALTGIGTLRRELRDWYRYYAGYDPLFNWWVRAPYEQADGAFEAYENAVRERLANPHHVVPEQRWAAILAESALTIVDILTMPKRTAAALASRLPLCRCRSRHDEDRR